MIRSSRSCGGPGATLIVFAGGWSFAPRRSQVSRCRSRPSGASSAVCATSRPPSSGMYERVKSPPGPSLMSAESVSGMVHLLFRPFTRFARGTDPRHRIVRRESASIRERPRERDVLRRPTASPRRATGNPVSAGFPSEPRATPFRGVIRSGKAHGPVWDTIPNQSPHGKSDVRKNNGIFLSGRTDVRITVVNARATGSEGCFEG